MSSTAERHVAPPGPPVVVPRQADQRADREVPNGCADPGGGTVSSAALVDEAGTSRCLEAHWVTSVGKPRVCSRTPTGVAFHPTTGGEVRAD